jgi:hypothetical protein
VNLTSMLRAEFALAYKMHQSVSDLQYVDYAEVKSMCDELVKMLKQSNSSRKRYG